VALAGYTNAGKSSLFNVLTSADVAAEDQVFATLDPTMRRLALPFGTAILSDTVGFISDLPTTLIAAFRATLEEVSRADLILHVRDIAASSSKQQKKDVEGVLAELGVDTQAHDSKIIEVWNKVDLLSDEQREALACKAARQERPPVLISAATGEGLDDLRAAINEQLSQGHVVRSFTLDAGEGALVNWLYEHGDIQSRADDPSGSVTLEARLAQADLQKFEHMMAKRTASSAN
jgi:GTP-binding protein HflX